MKGIDNILKPLYDLWHKVMDKLSVKDNNVEIDGGINVKGDIKVNGQPLVTGVKLYRHVIGALEIISTKKEPYVPNYTNYTYNLDNNTVMDVRNSMCIANYGIYQGQRFTIMEQSGGGGTNLKFQLLIRKFESGSYIITTKEIAYTTSEWPALTDTVTEL